MKTNKTIISFGECLFDGISGVCVPGGAPLNFALACQQISDCDVAMISAVGQDKLGKQLDDLVSTRGVQNLVSQVDAPTGIVEIFERNSTTQYDIVRNVAYDRIPVTTAAEQAVKNCDYFVFGTLASRQASGTTRQTLQHLIGLLPAMAKCVFDINLRPTFDFEDSSFVTWCLERTDILKINESEIEKISKKYALTGDMGSRCRQLIRRFGLSILVLTLGNEGSMIITADEVSRMGCPDVEVVDTVGCGDSFCAAFVSAFAAGFSLQAAHHLASEVSSFVATQRGGQPLIPERYQVASFGK